MLSLHGERADELKIFALYARALVAFQLGGEMLPLALEKAHEALALLAKHEQPTEEERQMEQELLEYISHI